MVRCSACKSEIAAYDRRCRMCGAGVRRSADELFADSPTDKELSRARLCHLIALPGMLILAILIEAAYGRIGLWAFFPLNLVLPFVFWLLHLKSPYVRNHGLQALNFQLVWTAAIYAVWMIPTGHGVLGDWSWMLAHAVVWFGGMALVWISSLDASSAGDGKYPIRIPLIT